MTNKIYGVADIPKSKPNTDRNNSLRAIDESTFSGWLMAHGWKHSELTPQQRRVLHDAFLKAR
ncbi:hypothetical protein [Schlesneria sp. DSM 10557]|uniref:hypothetical protein n=1 Tax=Schlesneria sp. DSM 10557 TaxID=3044399 RepID=UPI00359FEA68